MKQSMYERSCSCGEGAGKWKLCTPVSQGSKFTQMSAVHLATEMRRKVIASPTEGVPSSWEGRARGIGNVTDLTWVGVAEDDVAFQQFNSTHHIGGIVLEHGSTTCSWTPA
jgi:hypothetical protein